MCADFMEDMVMGGHPIRDAHQADVRIMLMPRSQHTQLLLLHMHMHMLMLMPSIIIMALFWHDIMPKDDPARDVLRLHEALVDVLVVDECYGHPLRRQFLGQVHEWVDVALCRVRHH